ncbi:hypothetical protein BpHYR1_003535 [Brachionus plicatilis]|uniref:Uncharacterized protein n=1 Tax=Brachionus plicatilis TaxID=10195 RepID=A0A3M7QC91_BRAPC|nr:hypothetical protein BpHYR1_003535 [Brachionus plicatilis]
MVHSEIYFGNIISSTCHQSIKGRIMERFCMLQASLEIRKHTVYSGVVGSGDSRCKSKSDRRLTCPHEYKPNANCIAESILFVTLTIASFSSFSLSWVLAIQFAKHSSTVFKVFISFKIVSLVTSTLAVLLTVKNWFRFCSNLLKYFIVCTFSFLKLEYSEVNLINENGFSKSLTKNISNWGSFDDYKKESNSLLYCFFMSGFGRRKRAKMALRTRTSTGAINPALQSINLGNTVSKESENEFQNVNHKKQQQESNNTITKRTQKSQLATSSITIEKIVSKPAPKSRGRPKKIKINEYYRGLI